MKKHLFICLILFSFLEKNVAQEGIVAIARYDETVPPKLRYDDPLTEFKGGFEAFQNLFLKAFKLPPRAYIAEKAPDGMVGFSVDPFGRIINIEVIDSVMPEIDEEVERVLSGISGFRPQAKLLKFAIQYNVFPDMFRAIVAEKEQEEKDSLREVQILRFLENTKNEDLEKYVEKKQSYTSGGVWVGYATLSAPLSKYLTPTWAVGGDLNFFIRKWFFGTNIQMRKLYIARDFTYLKGFWAKDEAVNLLSLGFAGGYKWIEKERLTCTPFASLGMSVLTAPSDFNGVNPSVLRFLPTLGFFVDYKFRAKGRYSELEARLNTSTIKLRLAISPMNISEGRRGSVVDFGVGLGFSQRTLKIE